MAMAATALLQPTRSARWSIASERELRKEVMMFDSIHKSDSAQIKRDRIGAAGGKERGQRTFPSKVYRSGLRCWFSLILRTKHTSEVRSFQSMIVEPFGTKWEKSKSYSMHTEQ